MEKLVYLVWLITRRSQVRVLLPLLILITMFTIRKDKDYFVVFSMLSQTGLCKYKEVYFIPFENALPETIGEQIYRQGKGLYDSIMDEPF